MAAVWYSYNGSGTVRTQTRPQKAPLAEADCNDNSWRWLYTIQQRSNTLAEGLDGCALDVQGAPRLMHQESQGGRSLTSNLDNDVWGCPRQCDSQPNSLDSSGCTIWEQALVGPHRSRQARWSPTPTKLPSQIHSWSAAHNTMRGNDERGSTYTRASNLRLQITMIHS